MIIIIIIYNVLLTLLHPNNKLLWYIYSTKNEINSTYKNSTVYKIP